MGLSMGGSESTTNQSSRQSGTNATTYSAGQSSLQDQLMQAFSQMLPNLSTGALSPNVQNMETANANQINQNYKSVGDNMNKYLAARGFGKSGSTGKAAVQTELGRQGALAQNASNASGQQLSFDQTLLSDSLAAGFAGMGNSSTGSSSGTSDTSGFNWGASASAAFGH